jgi:hypothetical protein
LKRCRKAVAHGVQPAGGPQPTARPGLFGAAQHIRTGAKSEKKLGKQKGLGVSLDALMV